MAWTAPAVKKADGTGTITHTDWNNYVRDNLLALRDAPRCRVTKAAAQSIPNGTYTELLFDTERYDTAGLHSTVSNTGRLTAPVAGVYEVICHARLDALAAGTESLIELRKNGVFPGIARDRRCATGWPQRLHVATHIYLAAGDYVSAHVIQISGGSINVQKVANHSPEFMMAWVGNPGI